MNVVIDALSRKGTVWSLTVAAIWYAHSEGASELVLILIASLGAVKIVSRAFVEHKHGRVSAQ